MRNLKIISIILFYVNTTQSQTLIADFAPFEEGSKWIYSYDYSSEHFAVAERIDSLTIEIELLSIKSVENDTFVLLKIRKYGTVIEKVSNTLPPSISTIDDYYIDTAIVSNCTISPSHSYHSNVFPFWHNHTISTDSLHLGYAGNDSLYYYDRNAYSHEIFLQNIGLYSEELHIDNQITRYIETVYLKSFNGKTFSSGVSNNCKVYREKSRMEIYRVLPGINLNTLDEIYTIDGKKINSDKIKKSNSILITRQYQ